MAKKRVTFNLNEEVGEAAKDTVVWLQSKGYRITLSNFVEDAIKMRIAHVKEIKSIKRIPKRKRELSKGRLIE